MSVHYVCTAWYFTPPCHNVDHVYTGQCYCCLYRCCRASKLILQRSPAAALDHGPGRAVVWRVLSRKGQQILAWSWSLMVMVSPKPLIRNQTFKHTINQFMKVRSFHAHIVNTEQTEKVMRVKSFHVHIMCIKATQCKATLNGRLHICVTHKISPCMNVQSCTHVIVVAVCNED